MTTPAPPVSDHDDFERQLEELPTHSFLRTDENGAPMGPRSGGRPPLQWTRPGATAVDVPAE